MSDNQLGAAPIKGVLEPIRWNDGTLELLDQRQLPEQTIYLNLNSVQEVWDAIRNLAVRGAPAIGIAAAFGVVLGVQHFPGPPAALADEALRHAAHLATSRPTAVNLFWALDRMKERAKALASTVVSTREAVEALLAEAQQIQAEDIETNRRIGEHALTLFEDGMGVLTHCNAGGLATSKYGTALAPFYLALEQGIALKVYADELGRCCKARASPPSSCSKRAWT